MHSSNTWSLYMQEASWILAVVTEATARTNSTWWHVTIRIHAIFKVSWFCQFLRKIKNNPPMHSSNIWSLYVQENNWIPSVVTEQRRVQTPPDSMSHYEFSKFRNFFNFWEKSKITRPCTAPTYGLCMCKRTIESLQWLPSNGAYKPHLMACQDTRICHFQSFVILSIFEKIQK